MMSHINFHDNNLPTFVRFIEQQLLAGKKLFCPSWNIRQLILIMDNKD